MTRPDTISPPPEVSDLSLHGKQLVGEMIQLLVLSCPAGPIEPTDEYQAARDSLLRYIAGLEADKRRLDWLEAFNDGFHNIDLISSLRGQFNGTDSLRSAIDTAQEKPE